MSEQTASADFAALLRELKDRSGLSYGVLAKRLHMSTSTLHRYCNGDAVPADYAPVERLARLCKARPGELVELHRRWVLADAARGRKGAAVAGTPSPEAGSGTRPGEVASEAAPPPEASPADAPSADGPRTDAPSVDSPSAAPVGPTHTSPSGAGAPSSAPTHADALDTATPAPARRRTRTAVLAGIAVAAVAAGVALAVGLPGGGGSGGDGDGGGHRPVGAAGVTGEESASASSSPSSSAGASPFFPAEEKGPARTPAGAAPAGAPDGEGRKSGVPVTVQADPYAWESPCSQRYLADKPASGMKPPPLEEGAAAWVAAHDAVSSGQQYLRLTVQGTGPETVVVDGLTVRVAGKRAPLAWNDYAMAYPGVGCGGGVQTRAFAVSLDSARPSLAPEPGNDDFPFKVSESDPEVYYITASVSAYDVDWYLELKWSSGDRSGTLTVDDEGRPFRTSGNKGRPAYEFPIGGDGWVPEGTTKLD
ncbi:helix-turn-helix domain-containing protein [Streptomyces griseoincarnatus]|uniref:Helix-turn-helix domain-containing protein n=1 Tax=Streptomyces griseoincarnatus TaxID=29305 RepID=A0ABT0VZF2_STRGI|nr:helix-turn-helix transcriptional regulator [Streptomyces griseoincarnatus]MCM2516709.1 helix-turn-helix domain-containing protein [Streptomyces griseoincarnatus]